ncbi:hypothetical protein PENANT_c003G01139 [Penicillium antarcticum]|uniref:Serine hydrolase domain-containing protein n=1 Tax=Penicillium antarcticum TaxID=416450 RepID=A0A1V6QHY2_9EURO|nr:uncharacterized protein N7508_005759 [Penicillium antarcticum]KAJ5306744.1 hypothetical protein N7508_005759 [Penicillium antarcticum]OQD88831.1 hypothetical protein PENANT_c003G01139 [Penicillium antarcticum]
MRFLCLHGSVSSSDKLDTMLAPLQQNLKADNSASFDFINATIPASAPEELMGFFGPPPHYRWLDYDGIETAQLHDSVRTAHENADLPAEELLRSKVPCEFVWTNHKDLMDQIDKHLEANPDIEGLLAYSEGATVAGAYLLHEQRMEKDHGRPRRVKCAMFFAGMPPMGEEKGFVLADEREDMIDIQTMHIIGAADPYRCGADSLYNLCDPDTAHFFDTGKGHTIPRGEPIISELGNAVREMLERAKEE